MATTILRALTVPEIRKKLAFTALLLALYRLGSHIPVPGIDVNAVNAIQQQFGNGGILNPLNPFSGARLQPMHLFALGHRTSVTGSTILCRPTRRVPTHQKQLKWSGASHGAIP